MGKENVDAQEREEGAGASLTTVAMAVGAAAALAACGGGGGDDGSSNGSGGGPVAALDTTGYRYNTAATDEDAARFLLQAQFSASDAEVSAVRQQGYAPWLAEQMARTGQTGWDWLDSKGYADPQNTANYYDQTYPGDHMIWNQLMTSPDAVRKRAALALSEFFVVSLSGLDFSWRSHAIAAWWDLLARHAFGNFRELLEAVTLNPAMGWWLNTKGNQKENNSGRQPDQNYAREVMQLFTIGLVDLNPDGTEKRDAQGNKIESYTQSDVTNLARVFTGYDFDQSQNQPTNANGRNNIPSTHYTRLPMSLRADRHSMLEAKFLGATVPANTPAPAALKIALDTLFNHPNTGPFFAKQMIQRLVTSNPSPAYVGRVAAKFADNGAGVRGDLRAVFAAIWLDDEARGPQGLADPAFGKLREPMLRFVQWGRTFGLQSTSGNWRIGELSSAANQLGQSPLRSSSVFNFFRPGYVPPSTQLATNGQVAPEFQIVSESSVGGYLNFMRDRISGSMDNNDMRATYTQELALVTDAAALVRRLNLRMAAGQLSPATEQLIVGALNATTVTAASSNDAKRNRVYAAVLMVMASAEYLVQK